MTMGKEQQLHFTNDVNAALGGIIAAERPNRTFVLADTNTERLVVPQLAIDGAQTLVMGAGDTCKTLDSLSSVWTQLGQGGATRHSLLINVGGGVVTDLGGFAAATFKRGMRCVNVPTTLLGAVDAAVGGKTGINFNGLKNEIGAFAPAAHVVISTCFFGSLPQREVKSGFAEMLKHAMLSSDEAMDSLLGYDLDTPDPERLLALLRHSVEVKERIVKKDPEEHGLRKALNLGHTVGHALESTALKRGKPVPHGYAVAWGLVAETVLSHLRLGFPSPRLHRLAQMVRDNYGAMPITCDDYPSLTDMMRHDKKSLNGEINCTLLAACGDIHIDQTIAVEEMNTTLDIFRDLMGL